MRLNGFLAVAVGLTAGAETGTGMVEAEGFFTGDTVVAGGLATCFFTIEETGACRVSAEAGWRTSPPSIAENKKRGFTPEP